TAFAKPFVWWIKDALDADAMNEAASRLQGFADFRSFSDDDPDETSTTVEVQQIRLEAIGDLVLVRMVGSHFLWTMVRRVVGVLPAVGRGEFDPETVASWLTSPSPVPAQLTAPASGLFLERVFYDPPDLGLRLAPVTPIAALEEGQERQFGKSDRDGIGMTPG